MNKTRVMATLMLALVATISITPVVDGGTGDGRTLAPGGNDTVAAATAGETGSSDRELLSAIDGLAHVLRLQNEACDPLALVRGSRAAALAKAADTAARLTLLSADQDIPLRRHTGISVDELAVAMRPLLIKVRATAEAKTPNHYVVLESVDGDAAVIYTGAGPRLRVPLDVLAWYFGGEVIAAGTTAAASPLGKSAGLLTASYIAAGLVGLLLLIVTTRPGDSTTFRQTARQAAGLLALATIVGGGVYLLYIGEAVARTAGRINKRGSVLIAFDQPGEEVKPHAVNDVTAAEFRAAMQSGGLVLDVREESQYRAQHVAGALNVPDLSEKAMRLRLAGIPGDQLLLVYCADITCPRGRVACGVLQRLGYSRVLHYPEGWKDLKDWSDLTFERGAAPVPEPTPSQRIPQ